MPAPTSTPIPIASGTSHLWRWLRRYLPAELVCIPAALAGAFLLGEPLGGNEGAALGGAIGENAGFYGMMLGRELRQRGGLAALPRALRDLSLEFGPAEALDSLLLRPALLYLGIALAPHAALGVLAGKLAADAAFYSLAIAAHGLVCRRRPSEPAGGTGLRA
jgi:hypothetical protein